MPTSASTPTAIGALTVTAPTDPQVQSLTIKYSWTANDGTIAHEDRKVMIEHGLYHLEVGLLVPLVLSCAWLAFVRRFDRLHPEPVWLVAVVFALTSFVGVCPAYLPFKLSTAGKK